MLAPSPEEAPDSSLSHMFGVLLRELGSAGSGFDVGAHVHVSLDALVTGEALEFEGEVRWRVPVPTGEAHGLAFYDVAPEIQSRLRKLLEPTR